MKQKFAEISGTLMSMVIVGCTLYFTKSLVQFILTLFVIAIVCAIVTCLLSNDYSKPLVRYILCDPANNKMEISEELFYELQKIYDKQRKGEQLTYEEELIKEIAQRNLLCHQKDFI